MNNCPHVMLLKTKLNTFCAGCGEVVIPEPEITVDAWHRVNRALNWRTAELKANGIDPVRMNEDMESYPPDNYPFVVERRYPRPVDNPLEGWRTMDDMPPIDQPYFATWITKAYPSGHPERQWVMIRVPAGSPVPPSAQYWHFDVLGLPNSSIT